MRTKTDLCSYCIALKPLNNSVLICLNRHLKILRFLTFILKQMLSAFRKIKLFFFWAPILFVLFLPFCFFFMVVPGSTTNETIIVMSYSNNERNIFPHCLFYVMLANSTRVQSILQPHDCLLEKLDCLRNRHSWFIVQVILGSFAYWISFHSLLQALCIWEGMKRNSHMLSLKTALLLIFYLNKWPVPNAC